MKYDNSPSRCDATQSIAREDLQRPTHRFRGVEEYLTLQLSNIIRESLLVEVEPDLKHCAISNPAAATAAILTAAYWRCEVRLQRSLPKGVCSGMVAP